MGSRLSHPVRFLTLLFAAMQFAAPAVLSVADGSLAREGRTSTSHIEEVGGKQCRAPHSEDCLVCRFLSATHGVAAAAALAPLTQEIAPASTPVASLAASADRHGFNSRAPPAS
jgi:hypothetical protein